MKKPSLKIALMATVAGVALGSAVMAQDAGFSISEEGKTLAGDTSVTKLAKRSDVARNDASVRVQADGLGVKPRLDLEVVEAGPGRAVLRSRVNYPAWVVRGEVRLLERASGRVVLTAPLAANTENLLALPGGDLVAVYRVYDSAGRYDETAPVTLDRAHAQPAEAGIDRAARRRIPVVGGAVTVSGTGVAPGARVQALGENFTADPSGAFVLQRILPPGDHAIPVQVSGAGQAIVVEPLVTIPAAEWFTIATADLTFGRNLRGPDKGKNFNYGRLAYYTKGKTASGWEITSSADTGEEELRNLFRNFDRKDPQGVLSRLDPDLAYPVYGDDSTLENDAPTNGKFYLRAERDGSHIVWGNFKGELTGAEYLRNERSLYGLQGVYRTPAQTTRGEARATLTLYASQPDNLPGREVFLGTGGSVYFLQRQDISIGSETITVETRDPVKGRVLSSQVLVEGRDYQINYLQGVVTLSAPLSGFASSGVLTPEAGSSPETRLTVQYEFTPTAGTVDGYAYGGRAEAWVTDQLRLGVTGMVEQTDIADQKAHGADIRYVFGKESYVEAEFARTSGPGFGQSYSADGGLIVTNTNAVGGTGTAYRFKTRLDFADLGLSGKGAIEAYAEQRKAGFSTLDHQVTADEDLWGVAVEAEPNARLSYRFSYDAFKDSAGRKLNEGMAELSFRQNERLTWGLGLSHEDRAEPGNAADTGTRTDLALRLTVTQSAALTWYVFGQTTLDRSGGRARNDRAGLGLAYGFGKGWTLEGEVSGGTAGAGGKVLARYEREGQSAYFGYTLDPGRELSGVTLNGRDAGQFVAGGKRRLGETVAVFAENTYDLFGQHRSLLSTYGVEYEATKFLTLSANYELGRVTDPSGDFDRNALSLGLQYQTETGLSAKARLELRRDRGTTSGTLRDADSVHFKLNGGYEVDEARKWLFAMELADAKTDNSSVLSGTYAKATLGYAFRPVDNDRLNLLARYTYLYDMYGQRVNNTNTPGPRQKSHVFSIDATYDLNQQWEVGGKLGFRLSESSPDGVIALARNDAFLGVVNARYHLTHEWDLLLEGRYLKARQAGLSEFGLLGTAYRHMGNNLMLGLGYNFGKFSDDLTDLSTDNQGIFLNLIAKY